MTIYARCPRCNTRLEVGAVCRCYEKRRTSQGRSERDSFYLSSEWGQARARAIRRTHGLDIVEWYEHGVLLNGFTVHHIAPLEIAWELRTDADNLIYLTEKNHRLIHELYRKDYIGARDRLRELLFRFDAEYGKFKSSSVRA